MKRLITTLLILLLLAPLAAGCSNQSADNGQHGYTMAPLTQMPPEVQQAPSSVRQAYQFAAHNQDVLDALPCYCGCGAMGHISNYSCYVSGKDENGGLTYDTHALGCQICVDITQDAMRMLGEGQSLDDIYAYVEATYSRFGPPTTAAEGS
ncbi:MAG TPA: PCYCGC motif-containing (lipo)protein [Candidatus Sulfomarinibacteraceae bacterium]|nr:PCYCGC motif-containing (lipo)protein [Candidatus Sulfomarinibacteraceae bacterium]